MSDAADNVSDAVGFTPKTALVFLIFLAAGPPLGFLLIWATGMMFGYGQPAASYGLSAYLWTFGFFAIASYIAGGAQALFLAFVASIAQAVSRTGLVPFRPVFLGSLFVTVAYAVFVMVKSASPPAWERLSIFLVLHVGSTIWCWLICNTVLWPFRRRSDQQVLA
ncbi:asparagine N-glycosylation enzyme membrane subunit Stt3 [Bradyrhizobium algeriense]|uniref:Asparagine N-glycosylation enzyme membrane subunit Stt3 n=1 Tax=Bradyrhizobium algeriense TaxID=634784 RepID=A0ABU8B2E9_9BRAD